MEREQKTFELQKKCFSEKKFEYSIDDTFLHLFMKITQVHKMNMNRIYIYIPNFVYNFVNL